MLPNVLDDFLKEVWLVGLCGRTPFTKATSSVLRGLQHTTGKNQLLRTGMEEGASEEKPSKDEFFQLYYVQ